MKMSKKDCKNVLTKTKRSDNICKHSEGERERELRNGFGRRKEGLEKNLKKFEKSLDKGCAIWYTL